MTTGRRFSALILSAWLLIPGGAVEAQELPSPQEMNQALQRWLAIRKQAELHQNEAPDAPGITQHGLSAQIGVERGDEVTVAGRRYRLWGIATPAPNEYGGYTSAQELKRLLDGKKVACVTTGETADRDNGENSENSGFLPLARCKADGKDVAGLMVRSGYARDCPRQSRGTYAAQERQAVAMVGGGFDLPSECLED